MKPSQGLVIVTENYGLKSNLALGFVLVGRPSAEEPSHEPDILTSFQPSSLSRILQMYR